jgi:hypothetical protein
MNIKFKNLIIISLTSCSLISCNIINDNKNARIETSIQNVKISNALRSYNKCIDDGKSFDNLASSKKEEADSLYNKSAKILNDCDALIQNNLYMVNETERMKIAALSIQNYIKAGNLVQASMNFQKFQNTFNTDLIYKNGSSFIENVETILTHNDSNISGKFALINNSKVIRSELNRLNYWSKN